MGHKLDDRLLITDVVQTRLGDEANFDRAEEDRRYWRCLCRSDGSFVTTSFGITPPVEYQIMARDLVRVFNDMIAHDGAWIAGWTNWHEPTVEEVLAGGTGHPERLIMLWLDHGGDPQFTVEIEESFADIVEKPLIEWVKDGQEAWERWHHAMREVLAPKPDQLYFAAQGERPPGSTVH